LTKAAGLEKNDLKNRTKKGGEEIKESSVRVPQPQASAETKEGAGKSTIYISDIKEEGGSREGVAVAQGRAGSKT